MEMDNEITGQTGSHYFFKYRIYNNRIVRFFDGNINSKEVNFHSPPFGNKDLQLALIHTGENLFFESVGSSFNSKVAPIIKFNAKYGNAFIL